MSQGLTPSDAQCVTASQLVRNFGFWQDRAARSPVYVVHRGRLRLALTSVELLEAMCAPLHEAADLPADRGILFDTLDEMVVELDAGGRIERANRSAAQLLGPAAAGGTLATALPAPLGGFLDMAARRVRESRLGERIEVARDRAGAGRLAVTIVPLSRGCALVLRDLGWQDMAEECGDALAAIDTAIGMLEGVARCRISQRGYLFGDTRSVAMLTRLSPEALGSVRFVSLIEIRSRVMVGEAIEQVLRDAAPRAVDAMLLVDGAAARPVRIAIAPIARAVAVTGVQAFILCDRAAAQG